jgi:translation initiation factor 6
LLKRLDINGNPYIGVFCRASDSLALVSRDADSGLMAELHEALEVPLARITLGGSRVIGALCALNSAGVAVGDLTSEGELELLRGFLPEGPRVLRLATRFNAIGNNVLVNDRTALVHPEMGRATVRKLSDFWGVEVERGTIAGMKTVGSAAMVTNKGVLCHPKATEQERKLLSELFKLPVTVGTANYGSPMIGACAVANSKGAVAGSSTTGIEMGRLEEALGFL